MRLVRTASAVLLLLSLQSLALAQLPPDGTKNAKKDQPVAPGSSTEELTKVIRLQSEAILELQKRLQDVESRLSVLETPRPRSDATGKGK